MLAYSAVFARARSRSCGWRPARWPSVLGGIALAAVIVCGYALLTKVFPAQLDAERRLRAPARNLRLLERDSA